MVRISIGRCPTARGRFEDITGYLVEGACRCHEVVVDYGTGGPWGHSEFGVSGGGSGGGQRTGTSTIRTPKQPLI